MSSNAAPIFTIAQVSDTHFIEQLDERGRTLLLKKFMLKSHAYAKIRSLVLTFDDLRESDVELSPDFLVVTGDVSTDGAYQALETAREYFEKDNIERGLPRRSRWRGLDYSPQRSIIIPGNHDRYGKGYFPRQTATTDFELVFGSRHGFAHPDEYPYVVGYRRSLAQTDRRSPTILFFVFDSTLIDSDKASFVSRIARGHVPPEHCDWLRRQRDLLRRTGTVPSVDGGTIEVDFDACLRIAVLHHHPIVEERAESSGEGIINAVRNMAGEMIDNLRPDFTKMVDSENFVAACFDAEIDLVMFGHQHRAYHREIEASQYAASYPATSLVSHVSYFCCASTSEYKSKDNGFYIYKFDRDDYKVDRYEWNASEDSAGVGTSFVKREEIPSRYARAKSWL